MDVRGSLKQETNTTDQVKKTDNEEALKNIQELMNRLRVIYEHTQASVRDTRVVPTRNF